jgi:glutathione S-transferase
VIKMSDERAPVLWHLTVSNFNEKARWALDFKRIPHARKTVMPLAHSLVGLYLTHRVATFPVLELEGRAIGDSTQIIAALEQRFPDPPLYPADPAERRRALELEEFFDENLGHDLRRVVFWELLAEPELMRSFAGELMTPRQAHVVDTAFPAIRAMLSRRYSINERSVAQSLLKVEAAMRLIEHLVDDGEYLIGERFTVADLSGAALLAPIIAPPEFPYRVPDPPRGSRMHELAARLGALPAASWVLRTYARHRPPSAEIGPETAARSRNDGAGRAFERVPA